MKLLQTPYSMVKRRKQFATLAELPTREVLHELSFVERTEGGQLIKTGLLKRVERAFSRHGRRLLSGHGYEEIALPTLQDISLWESSSRFERFSGKMYHVEEGDSVVIPTTEEPVHEYIASDTTRSHRELPLRVMSDQTLHRVVDRSSYVRSPEFHYIDGYSLQQSGSGIESHSRAIQERVVEMYESLGIDVVAEDTEDRTAVHITYEPRDGDALHVAAITELGTTFGEALGATFVTESGGREPLASVNVSLGVERSVYALVDAHRTTSKEYPVIEWPTGMAPFAFGIVQVDGPYARELYEQIESEDVLLDNTSDPVGTQIARMHALGVPEFVVVGENERESEAVVIERTTGDDQERISVEELPSRLSSQANASANSSSV